MSPAPFREGTHRAVPPEVTLARTAPLLAAAGITRVGMLTGLDTLGIPVAAAYRPNSRTIAVHQGKGATVAAAKASAVMEAIETFHAETLDLPLRLASVAALPGAVDPMALPRTGPRDLRHERILWVAATRLRDTAPVWVPHELVGMDLTTPGAGLFQATTNGLASGNTQDEALLHGLCEVIERDAVALWQSAQAAAQDARALDLATIDDPLTAGWLARIAAAGLAARVWDVTCDIAIPAFACLLTGNDDLQPELGFGCHPDRAIAVARAVGEAAQARLTIISGARDDVGSGGYGAAAAIRQAAARRWLAAPSLRDFRAVPSPAGALPAVLAALDGAGYPDACFVDLTRPGFDIPVLRTIIPGLEGPWSPPGGAYQPGPRALA